MFRTCFTRRVRVFQLLADYLEGVACNGSRALRGDLRTRNGRRALVCTDRAWRVRVRGLVDEAAGWARRQGV